MKWQWKLFLAVFVLLFFPARVFAMEQIADFESTIYVNHDASVRVVERIVYQTEEYHHGIYRYIPEKYTRDGFTYKAKVSDVRITDNQDVTYQYSQSYNNGNVVFKIGDPDKTFTGEKVYLISYTLENFLIRHDTFDELYLDITGEGWQIPVARVRAVVVSAPTEILEIDCFSGVYGGDDKACVYAMGGRLFATHQAEVMNTKNDDEPANVGAVFQLPEDSKNVASFVYDQGIDYGENMTIAVKLAQNGAIMFPTQFELAVMFLMNNWLLFVIPLPLVLMWLLWVKKGRDKVFVSPNIFDMDAGKPEKLRPIWGWNRVPFVYEPLSISPGVTGMVLDERVDHQDIVAEIIDLVRKKYLQIVPIEKTGWFSQKDYILKRLKEAGSDLQEHQQYLLDALVVEVGEEVKLSSLKGKFYTKMDKVRGMIEDQASVDKMFVGKPTSTRGLYMALAVGLCVVVIIAFSIFTNTNPTEFVGLYIVAMVLVTGLSLVIAWQMPQRTAIGTNYMLQAKGLRETINRGKWREEIKEKHLFVEEVLPFAISLGVINKLAKDMEALNIKPPDYIDQSMLHGVAFSSFVNDFNSHTASTLAYNPSSSSSGGSGFGGGGSSGGGGGGGGGGSW